MRKIVCALIFALAFLCGCTNNSQQSAATETETAAAISFVDDDGCTINMDKPAEKIISLYSAHTENLYYLGVGDKVIGGYKTCVYPPEAAFLPKYDYSGDPEEIIAADPDLVLIRPFITRKNPDFVQALKTAGINVVSLYPDEYDKFDDYINKLALMTGSEDKAAELLEDFHNDIAQITAVTAHIEDKSRIFYESTETEIRTISEGCMADLAIEFAGGINICDGAEPMSDGSTIAAFGVEKVLENADNIDVYVSQRGSMNSGGNLISISQRPGYETIKAVKEGRVYVINEKIISSPTFRYVKGVREMARFLYPEIMDDLSGYNNDETATRLSMANIVVRFKHIPIYLPTSSSYYTTEQRGHTFGLFEDITWEDEDFDYVETAVESGYVSWDKEDDKEYFYPETEITRDELAQTIFVMGDFEDNDANVEISDISQSEHQRIVQTLVNLGVFSLENGCFNPQRTVTNAEVIQALEYVR